MQFGVANVSVVPVRSESSERSEMVTSLLFGEHMEVLHFGINWSKVRLAYDAYEGWVDTKMITLIPEIQFVQLNSQHPVSTTEPWSVLNSEVGNDRMLIGIASSLPFFNPYECSCKIGDKKYILEGSISCEESADVRAGMLSACAVYLNAPYLWGGRSLFGIDCSGLVQNIYKLAGIKISRDASQQVQLGKTLNFVSETRVGDLAFFDNEEGLITHVGICLEENKILHASGKVRIDILDHQGIYNRESKRYTHKLRVLQSIIG